MLRRPLGPARGTQPSITEAQWAGAADLDGRIVQIEPEYGQPSPFRTVVRIGYTALVLHVAFEAYGPDPDRLGAIVDSCHSAGPGRHGPGRTPSVAQPGTSDTSAC